MTFRLRVPLLLAAALIVVAVLGYTAIYTSDLALPTLSPSGPPPQLAPLSSFDDLPKVVSGFLWDNWLLDLIAQAFVLLASVVCCLGLLKEDDA